MGLALDIVLDEGAVAVGMFEELHLELVHHLREFLDGTREPAVMPLEFFFIDFQFRRVSALSVSEFVGCYSVALLV